MAGKLFSRLLVVDASVYRAAGPEGARFPVSKNCRETLKTILAVCHKVVFTDAIQAEWKRHRSRFSHTWLTQMYARKKVIRPEVAPDEALRVSIARMPATEKQIETMMKDVHLLEAALVSDRVVIALDETVRRFFSKLAISHATLADVVWVDPGKAFDELITWLEQGALSEPSRTLGAFVSPTGD